MTAAVPRLRGILSGARRSVARNVKAFLLQAPAHILFFLGLASIAYGFWLWHPPLGFIVGGGFLVWTAFLLSAESK